MKSRLYLAMVYLTVATGAFFLQGCLSQESISQIAAKVSDGANSTQPIDTDPILNANNRGRYGNDKVRIDYLFDESLQPNSQPVPRTGNLSIVAIVVNYTGGGYGPTLVTPQQVEDFMFKGLPDGFSVKSWYEKASNYRATISGAVFSATYAPPTGLDEADMTVAKQAASATGFDPAHFPADTVFVYFFPKLKSGCTSASTGHARYIDFNNDGWLNELNLTTRTARMKRLYGEYVLLHEFGHALSMGHDNYYQSYDLNGNQVAGSRDNFLSFEYGNENSVMGRGATQFQQYNENINIGYQDIGVPGAMFMNQNGWANTKEVLASGTYDIYPLDQPASGGQNQILKFSRMSYRDSKLNAPVSRSDFYISFKTNRLPISYDDRTGALAPLGINVEIGKDRYPGLVRFKMNNNTADQILLPGESYSDPISRATIRLNSINPTTKVANVTVTLPVAGGLPMAPTNLRASALNSSEVKISFTAGLDAYGNQVKGHKMVIDGREDLTFPFISCASVIAPGTYVNPWKCSLRDYCGSDAEFVVNKLGAGMDHEIKVYSLDGFGNLSLPVTTIVHTPAGADVSPPSQITNLHIISVTPVNPALPISRTNAGSVTVGFTQGFEDSNLIQAQMWLHILPNIQYPNGRQYGYGAGTLWMGAGQVATMTYSNPDFPLFSGQHFQIGTSTRDQSQNFSDAHWPPILNPKIEFDVP